MKKNRNLRLAHILLVIFLTIAISACSASSGGQSLFNLEDIPDGFDGPELISITSDSATIRFDTGVPTVCNAPFGETSEYGEVATIPMLSGATLDHVLTFSGLIPGTTYHYQIIATDNQGNVYRSIEDFTFTTESEPETSSLEDTNWLSLDSGAVVIDVSSNFGGASNTQTWGAESALDGKQSTVWSSNGDGDDAYIVVQLQQPISITKIVVQTRAMANDTAQIFSFTVTNDSGETYGPFIIEDASQPFEYAVNFVASSLRFDAHTTNGGNTGFVGLSAYGKPVSVE